MRASRPALRAYLLAAVVLLLDQASKIIARAALPYEDPVPVLPPIFSLRLVYNTGAAWSILAGARVLLVGLSLGMAVLLVVFRKAFLSAGRAARVAYALLLGGILGNLVDRALFGKVTDFLDFVFGTYHYPTFNIADSCICIGVVLYWIASLRSGQKDTRG